MKKFLMIFAAVILSSVFTGCSSIPEKPNLSGHWDYKYGKQLQKTGSFDLTQAGSKLDGVSNDAEGQYTISGTIIGPVVTLKGKCPKVKNIYIINAKMQSENSFKGTYTTSVGSAGKIVGTRR